MVKQYPKYMMEYTMISSVTTPFHLNSLKSKTSHQQEMDTLHLPRQTTSSMSHLLTTSNEKEKQTLCLNGEEAVGTTSDIWTTTMMDKQQTKIQSTTGEPQTHTYDEQNMRYFTCSMQDFGINSSLIYEWCLPMNHSKNSETKD